MNKAEASLFLQVTYGVGGIYNEFRRILLGVRTKTWTKMMVQEAIRVFT